MHCLHFSLTRPVLSASIPVQFRLAALGLAPPRCAPWLMAPQGLGATAPHFVEEAHGLPKALWQ